MNLQPVNQDKVAGNINTNGESKTASTHQQIMEQGFTPKTPHPLNKLAPTSTQSAPGDPLHSDSSVPYKFAVEAFIMQKEEVYFLYVSEKPSLASLNAE